MCIRDRHRDVHQLYLPDEPPVASGEGSTTTKVDLDAFPVSFVYGGASHYYGSTERAVSYLGKYFTNLRSEDDVPLPTTPSVSYTHLRAHETPEHLVCRLLLEKKN
eukprot:TRINITY_DN53853_c0_g1_i1.p2 TRINITY_DN53853_c0_g1~~TRINITY_DN53853_c0_g1_i1.p2  ORF type:complete len:106 (-),score=30.62 TRINITY_DN53853_c0_g1_i1:56-373(-)